MHINFKVKTAAAQTKHTQKTCLLPMIVSWS